MSNEINGGFIKLDDNINVIENIDRSSIIPSLMIHHEFKPSEETKNKAMRIFKNITNSR